MNKPNLNQFYDWVMESPKDRTAEIKVGKKHRWEEDAPVEVSVYVWDWQEVGGQFVQSVSEIDIKGEKERGERARLAELLQKYPQEGVGQSKKGGK